MGKYVEGQLVKIAPDTWEVRWPDDKEKAQSKIRYLKKASKKEPGWYLSKDRKSIVDSSGAVVSTEVYIVKTAVVSKRKKTYLRFKVGFTIYSAYTLKGPQQQILFRPTKLTELYQKKTPRQSTGKKCLRCGGTLVRRDSTQQVCARCQNKERICSTPGCGKTLCPSNKYGLCRKCYDVMGALPDSQVFNPFLGHTAKRGKRIKPTAV